MSSACNFCKPSSRTVQENSESGSTLILTKHEVQPIYIRDPDGSLREITEILVPNASSRSDPDPYGGPVQHITEENTQHEITFELIPVQDEPDQRRVKSDKYEKVMATILKLGNSKQQNFVAIEGKY